MKHEAEIQQQAIAETPCTETAPCFACLRCSIRLLNLIPEAARKTEAPIPAADGGGQWTPAPEKPDHYTFGPLSAERTITLTAAHVATLPTGERVELPAGTVLREGTGAIDHSHLLACARGVVDHDAAQALTGPVAHALLSALRAACGDSTEDVAVRAGPTCSRNEDEPRTLGEQLHDEHNRTAHADGSRCTCDPASAVLTERVGLPREPPRCTGKRPANAGTTGIECDEYACNVHGRGAIRRLREMAPSVQPANADRVGPDPIAALALAAYNATRAGLDRAIADHAKPRT